MLKPDTQSPLRKFGRIKPIQVFCIAGTLALFILMLCFLLSRGALVSGYFFRDARDTGMDFFHSIEYVRGRRPYELFHTLYPPLANLFFYFIYRCIPLELAKQWPADFSQSIAMRGTDLDLRTYQAPMIIFLLLVILSCICLAFLLEHTLRSHASLWAKWASVCAVFCHGMMTSIERGNILFVVVVLCLFYILFYDSKRAVMRELALIALAVAAGLKLYPALLGILLLAEKRTWMALRAVIYGILSVVLPCFLFHGGLANLWIWKDVLFSFGSDNATPWLGTSFSSILHRIALYAERFFGLNLPTGWFTIAAILVTVLLLVSACMFKKKWQRVLAAVMAIMMFHSQGEYIYCMMLLPMVFFLQEEGKFTNQNIIPFLGMLFLMIPLPVFNQPGIFHPRTVILQALSISLLAWCLITALKSVWGRSSRLYFKIRKEKEQNENVAE